MIQLEHISKVFDGKKGQTQALKNVSLSVQKGEIFGVIGYSGAGKSTLVRCVNLLERPTEGRIMINDRDLTTLSNAQLNESRRKIGMIFQGFNLLSTATVYQNIFLPLKLTGVSKKEANERVVKYLRIVGLEDKQEAYPAQLSGGQKQRVAIARALAHEPEVLLSDEATSALDPDTTEAILDLLLKINRELNITILLITHEMHVIQKVCDHVAVMENGEVIESGSVLDIFTDPQHTTTKRFTSSLFKGDVPQDLLESLEQRGSVVTLSFVGNSSEEPALAAVSKKFDVYPNILSGNITQLKDQPFGRLVVFFEGNNDETTLAINYLESVGVKVEGVDKSVRSDYRVS
ncbi:ATP-binding cassette domain-containing protein [Virgibacillus siamensis]|uniref:ATP-binding cassette domain-containing protein n=1 Tax=Virgibacillus siamensis TaxID=480071 RepID=A0ABP3QI33_9BACI